MNKVILFLLIITLSLFSTLVKSQLISKSESYKVCFQTGLEVLRTEAKSFKTLDAVCDIDPTEMDPAQAYTVGLVYLMGTINESNSKKAYQFLLVAAKKDYKGIPNKDLFPHFMIATILDSGQLGKIDKKRANKWFQRSCDSGYAEGCRKFANRAFYNNIGLKLEESLEVSVEYYEKAYLLGNKDELSNLAILYIEKKNYFRATQLLLEGAELGSSIAHENLGAFYRTGTFLPQSYEKSFEHAQKASQAGYVRSQYNMAWLYLRGEGTHESLSKAKEYFAKAANQGDKRAEIALNYISSDLFENSNSLVSPKDIFNFDIYSKHPEIESQNKEFGTSLEDFIIQISLANQSWQGYMNAGFHYIIDFNDWESGCKLLKMVNSKGLNSFLYNEFLSDCYKNGTISTNRNLLIATELMKDSLQLVKKQNPSRWLEIYNKHEELTLALAKKKKAEDLRNNSGFVSVVENTPNNIRIRVDGDFDNKDLISNIHKTLKNRDNITVNLNSNGGLLDIGLKLGELFQKLNATVVIGVGDDCYSSCAFAFLGGRQRVIDDFATIGFHRPYMTGSYRIEGAEYTDILEAIIKYLEATDVDRNLFELFLKEGAGSLFIPNKNISSVLKITT